MARRVIATAAIEISGDSDAVERSLERIQRDVITTANTIDRRFREAYDAMAQAALRAGSTMERAMTEVKAEIGSTATRLQQVQDNFIDLGQVSGIVGERIESHMRAAANSAANDLARMAASGQIATEDIETQFRQAADIIQSVLERIDDGQPFQGIANDASRVGEEVTSHFREAARQSERHMRGIGGALGVLGGLGIASIVGQMTGQVVRWGAETRMTLEDAEARFMGLTGSAEEAKNMLTRMTEYAINTPFTLPGLADVTSQLAAQGAGFGVTTDNVLEYVDILGNATSALGQDEAAMQRVVKALSQMSGSGRVLGNDINQIYNALPGFNPWQALAEGYDTTQENLLELYATQRLTEFVNANGGAQAAVEHLLEGMTKIPGAAGAMDRRMETLTGVMSKFQEQAQLALDEGMQPFFEAMKGVMSDPAILQAVSDLSLAFGRLLSEGIGLLLPHLPTLLDVFRQFTELIGRSLMPILPTLMESFFNIAKATAPLIPALASFAEIFANILIVMSPAIEVMSLMVAIVADLLSRLHPSILTAIAGALTLLWFAMGGPVTAAIIAVAAFAGIIITHWDTIMKHTQGLRDAIVEAWDWVYRNVIEKVGGFVADVVNWFQKLYDILVGNSIIPDLVNTIVKWFGILFDIVGTIVNAIRTVVVAVWNVISTVVSGIVSVLVTVIGGYFKMLSSVVSFYVDIISAVARVMFAGLEWAWNNVVKPVIGWITDKFSWLSDKVTYAIDVIKRPLEGMFGGFAAAWNNVVVPIAQNIVDKFNWMKDKVLAVVNFVTSAWDRMTGKVNGSVSAEFSAQAANFRNSTSAPTRNFFSQGGMGDFGRGQMAVLHGREAIVPLDRPRDAARVMRQAGLDRMGGGGGALVEMHGTIIQDATDADLVAQRTIVAMQAAMVAA